MARSLIEISDQAREDLADLRNYLLSAASSRVADRQLSRITSKLKMLGSFPGLGRMRPDLASAPRRFAVPPWVVIYEPLPGGGIAVWRVIHGSRDLELLVKRPD